VLGCVSLIVWSLILVVTVKYVGVLTQADNRGEGVIIALLALVPYTLRERAPGVPGTTTVFVLIGAPCCSGMESRRRDAQSFDRAQNADRRRDHSFAPP
jgi:KUP system potassium uptake protein